MQRVLLSVHDSDDLAALPATAKKLIALGAKQVCLFYSPAIVIDQKSAAEKYDADIVSLRTAYKAAKDRDDLDAAKSYKEQLDGKILERGKAIRDAWRHYSVEARTERATEIFKPFFAAFPPEVGLQRRGLGDHYDRGEQPAFLNAISVHIPDGWNWGDFSIATPVSIVGRNGLASNVSAPAVAPAAAVEKPTKTPPAKSAVPPVGLTREQHLRGMRYLSLKSEAKKAGIEVFKGMPMETIVTMILAKENLAKAA